MPSVDASRPYEPTGMTTARWAEIPVSWVRVADLVLAQDGVSIDGLLRHREPGVASWCGDRFVHVVAHDGRLYLADGHHRLAASLVRGERYIPARVLRRPDAI